MTAGLVAQSRNDGAGLGGFIQEQASGWMNPFAEMANHNRGYNDGQGLGMQSLSGQRFEGALSLKDHLALAESAMVRLVKLAGHSRQISRHDIETAWLGKHRNDFRGQWIALDGDRLLSAGGSSKEVFAAVANHKPTPLVIYVPEHEMPFAGW